MDLGQKLRRVRQELGLSQKQLCGTVITRNMLSLIENGSASPSMETLRYLSGRLGKPMSYFLEEDAVTSPNHSAMELARTAYGRGEYELVLHSLEQYRRPDPIFDWEEALLQALALLNLAQEAISREKRPYALELLGRAEEAGRKTPYYTDEVERRRLLLLAQLVSVELPVDDRELLIRAETALKQNKPDEAARYLDAAQLRSDRYWQFLRGKVHLETGNYAHAQAYLEAAWDHDPKVCASLLEQCCREQEDFKGAYRYACFLREQND